MGHKIPARGITKGATSDEEYGGLRSQKLKSVFTGANAGESNEYFEEDSEEEDDSDEYEEESEEDDSEEEETDEYEETESEQQESSGMHAVFRVVG